MQQRLILSLVLSSVTSVFGQATFPGCGYLNGPECKISDSEYWNNGFAKPCDWGLAASGGTCVMGVKRQSLPFDQSWVVWAMDNQQRYSIGKDLQIDQILTVGTHNSYSSYQQGFASGFSTDQYYSITDQLQWGMRSIRIDPAQYNGQWRVCHGDATGCRTPAVSSNRLFSYAVIELADWLNAHPTELIFLTINGHNDDSTTDWNSILRNYISADKFYTPSDATSRYDSTTGKYTSWPTMNELRSAGKQIVLFSFHQMSDLGFSYEGQRYGIKASDPLFPACLATDSNSNLVSVLKHDPGFFPDIGEDRTASVATLGWGVVDEDQVVTAARCGYAMVHLDFVNSLPLAYVDFAELRADQRREAAVWSWAPNDYGRLGPAVMRAADGRWSSAPIGTNLHFACAVDTDARNRSWFISTASGSWTSAATACSIQTGGAFAFPRNGKENYDLHQAQLQAGGGDLWLKYSAIDGGSGVLVTPNMVHILHNGSSQPQLTFDVATTVAIPVNGVTVSFTMDLGNGSQTLDHSVTTASSLHSFTLPDLWATQKNPLTYNLTAKVSIRSNTDGSTLATTDVPFSIVVQAASTLTISTLNNPTLEGLSTNFHLTLSSDPAPLLVGTVTLFELVYDDTAQTMLPQTIAGPLPALGTQDITLSLQPGTHQIGAKFTSGNPLLLSSSTGTISETVVSYMNPTPASLHFVMDAGGALPAQQAVSGQTAGAPPAITSTAGWIGASSPIVIQNNFNTFVRPTSAAQSLTPGEYTAQITLWDLVHAAVKVDVMLDVRGTLQLSTNSVSDLTSGALSTTEIDLLKGGSFPLTTQFTGAAPGWLNLTTVPQSSNPAQTALLATFVPTGLAPGTYSATLNVSSTLASNTDTVTFTMTVVPRVTIDASFPGIVTTIDHVQYTLPQTFTWAPHTGHSISMTNIQGDSSTHYVFNQWSDSPDLNRSITAPTTASDRSAWHANFGRYFFLQADVTPNAGGNTLQITPSSSDGFYSERVAVNVTAMPGVGYTFGGFSGDLNGTRNPQDLKMDHVRHITASFVQSPVSVTITSSIPGLAVAVDNLPYTTPASFTWQQGSTHSAAFAPVVSGGQGSRYLFQSWTDSPTSNSIRNLVVGAAAATYTATFQPQFFLDASPSPTSGGGVTGGGWYNAGAVAMLSATPASGFQFAGFSRDATGSTSPMNVTMDLAKTVVANFGPSGIPRVFAGPGGSAVDSGDLRIVPISLTNAGAGAALGAQITSISNITIVSGTGPVAANAGPFTAGDLPPGTSLTVSVPFQWPSSATRIRVTVNFSANGSAYSGSTVLNLFR